jgi:hypothetical protein
LQVFILNASRRLFSDRFFPSSFRPEFYTSLGVRWVTENGPDGKLVERGKPNGHTVEVSPLKRVLLRNVPELNQALAPVVNAFRSVGARSRQLLFAAMEAAPRSAIGCRVRRVTAASSLMLHRRVRIRQLPLR